VIKEVKSLGEELRIRSMGHSSNDLVLGRNVLCTSRLNLLDESCIDDEKLTIRIPAGAGLAVVDRFLEESGFGLPVIGDSDHITAGGFASVGGTSPASHRFGLFVDNVLELEYVDWNGSIHRCRRAHEPKALHQVLTGTGRYGVITALTCQIYKVTKNTTIIENQARRVHNVDAFLALVEKRFTKVPSDEYLFHRAMWIDFSIANSQILIGQVCSYVPTAQSASKTLRKKLVYGFLYFLGYWAGRLPPLLEKVVRYLGIIGVVILPPRYGSIKDAEVLPNRVFDFSVGDASRMFTAFVPLEEYQEVFKALYDICLQSRARDNAIGNISMYVKAIDSEYLQAGKNSGLFVEISLVLFLKTENMTPTVLDALVSQIDELCIREGALRYMPTKTSKDEAIVKRIDPNYRYS
jgi:hypothetical protein